MGCGGLAFFERPGYVQVTYNIRAALFLQPNMAGAVLEPKTSKSCGWWISAAQVGGRKNFLLNRRTRLALVRRGLPMGCVTEHLLQCAEHRGAKEQIPGGIQGKLDTGASSAQGSSSARETGIPGLDQCLPALRAPMAPAAPWFRWGDADVPPLPGCRLQPALLTPFTAAVPILDSPAGPRTTMKCALNARQRAEGPCLHSVPGRRQRVEALPMRLPTPMLMRGQPPHFPGVPDSAGTSPCRMLS